MRNKICALLILFSATGAFELRAQESETSSLKLDSVSPVPKRKWTGDWQAEIGGTTQREGKDEGAAAYFYFKTKFEFTLSKWLSAHAEPRLELFSSRLQERYDNDSYENRIRLNGAYLSLHPVRFFEARAGAIVQETLDDPILISQHRAFPGVQEFITSDTKPVRVTLMAQQLVPTSFSLNTEREDKEALPSFQTQSVQVDGQAGPTRFRGLLGHYTWDRLPDKVAYQAALAGNTVTGGDVAVGSKLAYGFDGIFWGGEACLCLWSGPVQFEAGYFGEHNRNAPSASADAQLWFLGPKWIMGQRELSVRYYNYFLEPDATVNIYTRAHFGYGNRVGDSFEVKYDLKDLGWSVVGSWVNARTVVDRGDDSQRTFSEFDLWVETAYAPF